MKRVTACFIMCIFLLNGTVFAANTITSTLYTTNIYTHWAIPYASNIRQRLIPIKASLSSDDNITAESIDTLMEQVLETDKLDEVILSSNWNLLLKLIFNVEELTADMTIEKANEEYISRQDAIVNIMKVLEEKVNLQSLQTDILMLKDKFQDSLKVNEETAIYLALAVREGIVSGYSDQSLRPDAYLRNCEAITIIENICGKYGFPEVQWSGNISLIAIDAHIQIEGPQAVEEALWTNDNGILMVYSTKDSSIREAAKVFPSRNETVKALEYDYYNISETLLNENAFKEEKGYISANKIVWNKNRRYINKDGVMKHIYIPYVNHWISNDDKMVLTENAETGVVTLFNFLTEQKKMIGDYYRWADQKYKRTIKWSPTSQYLVSTLFKPDDDIGVGEKHRFAVFDCQTGELVRTFYDREYYSFYPTWSPDGKKLAFYRVNMNDEELKSALNNMVDQSFNLPVKEIGIYNISENTLNYYEHPESIILGKNNNGIIWSSKSDKLYIETATDKEQFMKDLNKDHRLNFAKVPNAVWELDLQEGNYKKFFSGQLISIQEELSPEEQFSLEDIFSPAEETGVEEPRKNIENIYADTRRLLSISQDNSRVLYKKQLYNLSRYENIAPEFIVWDVNSGQEYVINEHELVNHWWLDDGRLIFVESEMKLSSRNTNITYSIKQVNETFEIEEMATFTQFATNFSLSPDGDYLMLHQYRGVKDVKLIKLK